MQINWWGQSFARSLPSGTMNMLDHRNTFTNVWVTLVYLASNKFHHQLLHEIQHQKRLKDGLKNDKQENEYNQSSCILQCCLDLPNFFLSWWFNNHIRYGLVTMAPNIDQQNQQKNLILYAIAGGNLLKTYCMKFICDKPQHKIFFVCNFPHNNYYVCSCSFVIFHPYRRSANSCQTTDLNECLSKHTLRIKVCHQMTFPVERANLIQRLIEESLRN